MLAILLAAYWPAPSLALAAALTAPAMALSDHLGSPAVDPANVTCYGP